MDQNDIIKELSLIDSQEEALARRRRKFMRMLTDGVSSIAKPQTLSKEQIADALNKRDKTILKRTRRA